MMGPLLALLAAPSAVSAATLSVDPGDDSAYATINLALSAATSGDTIEIAPGTYPECVLTYGTSIDLVGLGESPEDVVLDGQGCEEVLGAWNGETLNATNLRLQNDGGWCVYQYYSTMGLQDVILDGCGASGWNGGGGYTYGGVLDLTGVTVRNSVAGYGAGLYLYAYTTVSITDSAFENNTADYGGGGLYSNYDSDVAITGTRFEGNVASQGDGGAATFAWYGLLSIADSQFVANTATGSGGALNLYAVDQVVPISDTVFARNEATGGYGGAMHSQWYNDLVLTGATFSDNLAGVGGGALTNWYEAHFSATDSVFSGNTASTGDAGALDLYGGSQSTWAVDIIDSSFTDNRAAANAGAVSLVWLGDVRVTGSEFKHNTAGETAVGGAIEGYVIDASDLSDSRFCGNSAGYGGAVGLQWVNTDHFGGNIVQENSAWQGGGLYRNVSYSADASQNTFVGNTATDEGGAYFASWAYSEFTNNLVAWTTDGHGVAAGDAHSYANSPMAHNGWFENTSVDGGGYFYVWEGADGNVHGDPLLTNYSLDGDCDNDDLQPSVESPLRDAGDPSLTDPDGSPSDIGAVRAVAPSGDGGDTGDGGDGGDGNGSPGSPETEEGGCATAGSTQGAGWLALGLALLGLRSRRTPPTP